MAQDQGLRPPVCHDRAPRRRCCAAQVHMQLVEASSRRIDEEECPWPPRRRLEPGLAVEARLPFSFCSQAARWQGAEQRTTVLARAFRAVLTRLPIVATGCGRDFATSFLHSRSPWLGSRSAAQYGLHPLDTLSGTTAVAESLTRPIPAMATRPCITRQASSARQRNGGADRSARFDGGGHMSVWVAQFHPAVEKIG